MSAGARGARRWLLPAGLSAVALVAVAIWRGGVLDLPAAPAGVTASQAGLEDLAGLARRADRLERAAEVASSGTPTSSSGDAADADSALALAAAAIASLRHGDVDGGLERGQRALRVAPRDLVIGNAFRMAVFDARRAALADTAARQTLAARVAPALAHEPIATFTALSREHPCREVTLQLALAWIDELLLFPALEIQAPASVESVNLLTALLADDPAYVPALYGRGLNYLHRPTRLVWPEARKAAPDAASRDIGTCLAIGRRIGGASPRLVATLALSLADAYAKEGRLERARSWWQIAENASDDTTLRAAVRRRFGWRDGETLDRLEDELESRRLDLAHPLTDLSVMWR